MEAARPRGRRRRKRRRAAAAAAGCLSAAAAAGFLRSSSDGSRTLRSVASTETFLRKRRALQAATSSIPPQCYANLLANPAFASGAYGPWEKHSVVPDFALQTVTPGWDGAADSALQFGDRYSRYQGVRQSLLSSADCLLPSPEVAVGAGGGESFYLTISYDVRMIDATTGQGISTCTTDRVAVTESDGRVQLARHSCPWVELVGRSADDPRGRIRAEVYDVNIVWDASVGEGGAGRGIGSR